MLDERVKKTLPGDLVPAFAFTNSGGIRATIDEGPITLGEVMTSFPFANEMVTIQLTGQQIWDMFEGIVARVNKNSGAKITSFVQVSKGVEVLWLPTNATANPTIGKMTSFKIGGKPLQMDKEYKVVTIDFLASGGDNFVSPRISAAGVEKLDVILTNYIKEQTPVNIALEQRLRPVKSCKKKTRAL